MNKNKVACIQINSSNNLDANIEKALGLINNAAKEGAELIALPENVISMPANKEELLKNSFYENEHPALKAFKKEAQNLNKYLLIGSMAIKIKNCRKLVNRSFLIGPDGQIIAKYNKIHLYDAQVKNGESHQESAKFRSGNKAVITTTPLGELGMTICYDLRFPHLFRKLAQNGAQIISVPSAFTYYTGEAHWHILLKARAIETGSYIIAPAQTGTHPSGRQTYGHSLIINPWGEIMAELPEGEGIIYANIDLEVLKDIRAQIPAIYLHKVFSF